MKPRKGNVVVEPIAAAERTKGGIWIHHRHKEEYTATARIVMFSDERCEDELKEGMVVIVNRYGGIPIEHEGQKLVILKESDIMAYAKAELTDPVDLSEGEAP